MKKLTEEQIEKIKKRAQEFAKSSKGQKILKETTEAVKKSIEELRRKRRIPDSFWHRRIGPNDRFHW